MSCVPFTCPPYAKDTPDAAGDTIDIFPIIWPATPEASLVNRFKEIAADLNESFKDCTVPQAVAKIREMALSKRVAWLSRKTLPAEHIETLKHWNSGAKLPWRWEHLLPEYQGRHYLIQPEDQIMEWEDSVRMWAWTRALCITGGAKSRM